MKRLALPIAVLAVALLAAPAAAFDANQTFRENRLLLSLEAGYGSQFELEDFEQVSDVEFWLGGVRLGWLPFGVSGGGIVRGAFEAGLQGTVLGYTEPDDAFFAGLGLVGRYHFLSLGRFVPFVEVGAYAGGTDLDVVEIDSDFSFMLQGGLGASYFIADDVAVYAGYRWTHLSNGGIESPNRGIEAHTGVAGVSFYLR